MSYKLTNISGGQIVCDLAVEGKTLRLNNKQTKTIQDKEITSHIRNMAVKRLILCEEVEIPQATKKENTSTRSKKKED